MKKSLFFLGLVFANCCFSQVTTYTWTNGYTSTPDWWIPENWTPILIEPNPLENNMGSCSTVYIFPSVIIEDHITLNNSTGTVNYSLSLQNTSSTTVELFNNGPLGLNFQICGESQGGYNAGIQGPLYFGGLVKPAIIITSPIATLSDLIYIPGGLEISGCQSLSGSSLDVLAVSGHLTLKDSNATIANLSLNSCVSSVELGSELEITQNSVADPSYSPQFLNSTITTRDSSQVSVITAMAGYTFQGSTINAVGANSVFGYATTSSGSTNFVNNVFNLAKSSAINISNQGSQSFSNNTFNLTDSSQLTFETAAAMGGQTNFNFTISGNSSPVVRFEGVGNVSSSYCHGACGSLVGNNLTYDLYLSQPSDRLSISVTTSAGAPSGQNIQIMQFLNGFGTVSALSANAGCCYNSPGLGTDNNFPLGTVSLFDAVINQNSTISLVDNPNSPYAVFWSDIRPDLFSSDYVGVGYVDPQSGQVLGVNGVFGLYVDVHSKHHSLGSVGSFQQTSNNQNTCKKMGK